MRAWIKGMVEALKPSETADQTSQSTLSSTETPALPVAIPVELPIAVPVAIPEPLESHQALPSAVLVDQSVPPAEDATVTEPVQVSPQEPPSLGEVPSTMMSRETPSVLDEAPPADLPQPLPSIPCPACGSASPAHAAYCESCGYYFPPQSTETPLPLTPPPEPLEEPARYQDRYERGESVGGRGNLERFRGLDHKSEPARPILLVRTPVEPTIKGIRPEEAPRSLFEATTEEIILDPAKTSTVDLLGSPWPSLDWEERALKNAAHPFLPAILDRFQEGTFEFLVLELPTGTPLWDAWDAPATTQEQRFTWLRHIAEQFQALHRVGGLLESLRPDQVIVTEDGRARLTDMVDLLPLPVPHDALVRGTLYTAPELVSCLGTADARANLYTMGAILYSLHVGRELTEMDFERPGTPKAFIPQFPDIHPTLGRLMMKTFTREVEARFPTEEASRDDPSGFSELLRTLDICARTLDLCRLEIAAWTTTGMVRAGNEDAFALMHACESRQDDIGEAALLLLADGMGGYEAGEVAAAMAISALRKNLCAQSAFASLAGSSAFPAEVPRPEGNAPKALDLEEAKRLILQALRLANREIFLASRGPNRRGMGCTAEVVYVDGRNVIVGHVGDSRTYHFHEGKLFQLTRDQTLVNRLVELGTLRPEEAETHPRRNELQQALGGQPEVDPGLYQGTLKPGDWVVVCSDGLSNHVKDRELQQMLQSEAISADMAARRLVNLVNIEGATDNATVVVIRAT